MEHFTFDENNPIYQQLRVPCDSDDSSVDFEVEDSTLVIPKRHQPTNCYVYNSIREDRFNKNLLYIPEEEDEESFISLEDTSDFDQFSLNEGFLPMNIKDCKETPGQFFKPFLFQQSGPKLAFFFALCKYLYDRQTYDNLFANLFDDIQDTRYKIYYFLFQDYLQGRDNFFKVKNVIIKEVHLEVLLQKKPDVFLDPILLLLAAGDSRWLPSNNLVRLCLLHFNATSTFLQENGTSLSLAPDKIRALFLKSVFYGGYYDRYSMRQYYQDNTLFAFFICLYKNARFHLMARKVETSSQKIFEWYQDFIHRVYSTPVLQAWYYCNNGGWYSEWEQCSNDHLMMTSNIKKKILVDLDIFRKKYLSISDWEMFDNAFRKNNIWQEKTSYGVHRFVGQEDIKYIVAHDEKMFGPILDDTDQMRNPIILNDDYWEFMKPYFFGQFKQQIIF
jgi:hypothetical protein